jgi:4-nitrophenyl phosphatase
MADDKTNISAMILDMDGVLWRQNDTIGDLPNIFHTIKQNGWKITLATNNATLSVKQYVDKLSNFGVMLENEQIVNSSQALVHYLSGIYPKGGRVFIIGEEGLAQTLAEKNFYHAEEDVLAVIVGMDRQLNWEKLSKATLLIRSGARFIGTNGDRTFPTPDGLIPGVGAILGALEIASDRKAFVVGKPAPAMYEIAMHRMHTTPKDTLVVGDRLETDILGGQQLGCMTALVLSGVTSFAAAKEWKPEPDWICRDLTQLIECLKSK